MKLTMAQALVKFLDNQYVCFDGREEKFVNGVFGIFGHGCVVGIGQALEQGGHSLTYYQGHNEQGMAHAAMAYAKQNRRRKIIACTSSIGPGALNMVTAAGTATANRIPLLRLPGCLQRLWRPGAKHTYHLEYGFSCMGYEICGALGVKLAEPEKEVYAMVGDGSFLMLHSELYTAVQEGAKINVLLFDNTGWGCIENLQNEQGTETFGTRFTRRNPETGLLDGAVVPIDFAKCAAGYGCKTYTATNVEELRAALADAKRQTVPTLIDIKVVHGSMSHGYDAWWRVGVAEVSASETVQKAYGAMQENIKKARLY